MANMRCTVKFFLDQITCPGTLHLPDRNPVFLSIYLFGRPQKSPYVYPSFPMSFCAKIKYQRLFTNAKTPEQLLEILEGGRVLAVFEENTRNFLFPTPSIIPERNLVKRDILLTRTDNFPILKGLDPQFTFRTKTYIEEGPFVHLNDDNDEPIPVTRQLPSSVSPKKNKSPARSISLLDIDYEDENELDDSSSPTKGKHCICDCPVLDKDPEAIDQWLNGMNLNKGKTNEKKPFLTGKAPKQLISRRVFDESPEKEKKYTGKGICNSCAIPLPTCVLCNAYKTVYGTNSFLAHRFNRKPKKNKKKRLKKKRVKSEAKTPSPVKNGKRNLNSSYDASKYINTSLVGNRTVDASVRTSDGNLRPMKEKSNSEYLVSKYSCDDSDVESLDGTSKLVLPPRSSTRASNAKALFMEERPKSVPPKSKPARPRLFNPPPVQRSLSEDELESARIHERIKNLMKKNNSELQYDLSSSDSLTDEDVKSDTNEDVLSESSDDDGLPIYLKTKKNLPTKSFVEPVESSKKWSSSSAADGLTYRERLDNRLKAIYADLYQKTLNNE